MSENGSKKPTLSATQSKAITELMAGASQKEAAIIAGVSETTVGRWMSGHEDFKQALRAQNSRIIHTAGVRLSGSLELAVDVMREIMEDREVPARTRLRAADLVITSCLRLLESSEIIERIKRLEEALARPQSS